MPPIPERAQQESPEPLCSALLFPFSLKAGKSREEVHRPSGEG